MAESLWNGRFMLAQQEGVFPLSMDTMALADFISLRPGERVWDLGCGSAPLALLLAGRDVPFSYTGVDLSPAACGLAAKNLSANGLHGTILHRDIARLPSGSADLVISNPPYFPPDRGKEGTLPRTGLGLSELCAAAARLLSHGGRFTLIYPAQRLPDLFQTLRVHRMEPKVMALLSHRADVPPRLALVEARMGGKPQLEVRPTLILFHPDGRETEDYRRMYHLVPANGTGELCLSKK